MATYTDNYQLTKPTYAEQADIGVINSNMNKIDNIMHSSQISLAPAYDQSQTYAEGDVVMYELLMYKCISPTTGVWDASKWERTTASESGGGGSAELDILGEASGAVASFADGASAGLAKCIAEINPVQDLHGYDKPWAGGAGKNKAPFFTDITTGVVTMAVGNDGVCTLNGNSGPASSLLVNNPIKLEAGTYTLSDGVSDHKAQLQIYNMTTSTVYWIDTTQTFTYNGTDDIHIRLWIAGNALFSNYKIYPMVRISSTSADYEPYSNICPISGHSSVTVTISDGETSTTKTTALGQTVYGGQLNVLTGELTIDRYMVVLDGVNRMVTVSAATNPNGRAVIYSAQVNTVDVYREKSLCDKLTWSDSSHGNLSLSEYTATVASGGTSMTVRMILPISQTATTTEANAYLASNNYTFVYPLATPQTVQLTPQEVNSLLGQNNISADTGDVDIVYVKASAPIQPNPTGTPTATLKKLGIEGTVFEVPSGGGGSSGGINYSTTEQKTAQKWIDGKDIYIKVITFGSINQGSNSIISLSGLSIDKITKIDSVAHSTTPSDAFMPLPISHTLQFSSQAFCRYNIADATIGIYTGSGISFSEAWITLYYTKITD